MKVFSKITILCFFLYGILIYLSFKYIIILFVIESMLFILMLIDDYKISNINIIESEIPSFLFFFEPFEGNYSKAKRQLQNMARKYSIQIKLLNKTYKVLNTLIHLQPALHMHSINRDEKINLHFLIGFSLTNKEIDKNNPIIQHFVSLSKLNIIEFQSEEGFNCKIQSNAWITEAYKIQLLKDEILKKGFMAISGEEFESFLKNNPLILFFDEIENNSSILYPKELSTQYQQFTCALNDSFPKNIIEQLKESFLNKKEK